MRTLVVLFSPLILAMATENCSWRLGVGSGDGVAADGGSEQPSSDPDPSVPLPEASLTPSLRAMGSAHTDGGEYDMGGERTSVEIQESSRIVTSSRSDGSVYRTTSTKDGSTERREFRDAQGRLRIVESTQSVGGRHRAATERDEYDEVGVVVRHWSRRLDEGSMRWVIEDWTKNQSDAGAEWDVKRVEEPFSIIRPSQRAPECDRQSGGSGTSATSQDSSAYERRGAEEEDDSAYATRLLQQTFPLPQDWDSARPTSTSMRDIIQVSAFPSILVVQNGRSGGPTACAGAAGYIADRISRVLAASILVLKSISPETGETLRRRFLTAGPACTPDTPCVLVSCDLTPESPLRGVTLKLPLLRAGRVTLSRGGSVETKAVQLVTIHSRGAAAGGRPPGEPEIDANLLHELLHVAHFEHPNDPDLTETSLFQRLVRASLFETIQDSYCFANAPVGFEFLNDEDRKLAMLASDCALPAGVRADGALLAPSTLDRREWFLRTALCGGDLSIEDSDCSALPDWEIEGFNCDKLPPEQNDCWECPNEYEMPQSCYSTIFSTCEYGPLGGELTAADLDAFSGRRVGFTESLSVTSPPDRDEYSHFSADYRGVHACAWGVLVEPEEVDPWSFFKWPRYRFKVTSSSPIPYAGYEVAGPYVGSLYGTWADVAARRVQPPAGAAVVGVWECRRGGSYSDLFGPAVRDILARQ